MKFYRLPNLRTLSCFAFLTSLLALTANAASVTVESDKGNRLLIDVPHESAVSNEEDTVYIFENIKADPEAVDIQEMPAPDWEHLRTIEGTVTREITEITAFFFRRERFMDGALPAQDEVTAYIHIMEGDLDIDADNDNLFGFPDGSDEEELLEEDVEAIGKLVLLNDGDVDQDGIPDYADGFDGNDLPGGQFIPIQVVLPSEIVSVLGISQFKLSFSYRGSDPALITQEGENYILPNGNMRIWTKDASEPRSSQSVLDGGSYVPPNKQCDIAELNGNTNDLSFYLYIEAINGADVEEITMTLWMQDEILSSDKVKVKLLKVDLVPDYDRDGVIDDSDRNKITDTNPQRWWLNNDDDISEVEGMDAPEDGTADSSNAVVDTARDLVDFFPVFIDLKDFLSAIDDLSTITVKLKHADNSLKFVYTDLLPENSKDYWYEGGVTSGYGSSFTDAPGEADTISITSSGAALSEAFLNKIKNDDKGVILLEGAGSSTSAEPLVLEVSNSSGVLFEFEMPLSLSPVDEMFRHVNLASHVGTSEDHPDKTGEPTNNPDSLSNGKHFAFIHGYNVSQDAAQGWHCEIFKRMHQMGSKAKFIGVTWDGDTAPDYHNAVYRAFRTSAQVAGDLGGFSDLTIAAHSLGNMVISNAMENHGFSPTRYYLMNAATPIEAYNQVQTNNSSGNLDMDEYMTESDWKNYPDRLYASNWYQLFPSSDARNELTWKDRFSNIVDKSYNFYSPGEDVVENAGDNESVTSALLGTLAAWVTGESIGTHAWITQEIAKGGKNLGTVAMLAELHGGWNWNLSSPDDEQVGILEPDNGDGLGEYYRLRWASETSGTVPSDEQLAQFGFFKKFNQVDLYAPIDDANTISGITQTQAQASAEAAQNDVQWHLLAEAIPAMSFAAAANEVEGMQGNYDMMANAVGWPSSRGNNRLRHSDFKNVSLNYVRNTFEEMINIGGLDND